MNEVSLSLHLPQKKRKESLPWRSEEGHGDQRERKIKGIKGGRAGETKEERTDKAISWDEPGRRVTLHPPSFHLLSIHISIALSYHSILYLLPSSCPLTLMSY